MAACTYCEGTGLTRDDWGRPCPRCQPRADGPARPLYEAVYRALAHPELVRAAENGYLAVKLGAGAPQLSFYRKVTADTAAATSSYTITLPCEERWATMDAAEAYELLATRGLVPLDWVGAAERVFVCEKCSGTGYSGTCDCGSCNGYTECPVCEWEGALPHPPSPGALLGWASMGASMILKAEEVYRMMYPRYKGPVPWSCDDWRYQSQPSRDSATKAAVIGHTTVLGRNLLNAGLYVRPLEDSPVAPALCVPPL